MAFQVYECTISGVSAGQFVQTVQHLAGDVTGGGLSPFAIARAIAQELDNAADPFLQQFVDCLPTDYNATSLRVRRVYPTGGPTAILVAGLWTSDTQGQRPGIQQSTQVNPLIIWIGTTLPSKTGRLFIPGVSEDDLDQMVLTPGVASEYSDLGVSWIAGITIAGLTDFKGAIYRRARTLPTPVAHTFDIIEDYYVSPLIGTQRRRLHPI